MSVTRSDRRIPGGHPGRIANSASGRTQLLKELKRRRLVARIALNVRSDLRTHQRQRLLRLQ